MSIVGANKEDCS